MNSSPIIVFSNPSASFGYSYADNYCFIDDCILGEASGPLGHYSCYTADLGVANVAVLAVLFFRMVVRLWIASIVSLRLRSISVVFTLFPPPWLMFRLCFNCCDDYMGPNAPKLIDRLLLVDLIFVGGPLFAPTPMPSEMLASAQGPFVLDYIVFYCCSCCCDDYCSSCYYCLLNYSDIKYIEINNYNLPIKLFNFLALFLLQS